MRTEHGWREAVDTLLLLVVLPMAGIVVAGKPVARYLEFPPVTRYVEHAGFSWAMFVLLAIVTLAVVVPFVVKVAMSKQAMTQPRRHHAFPWWGWLGAAVIAVNWVLAWTRFPWFAPLQPFTFSPFWFGYVLVVNAWTCRRSGHCMLRDRPGHTAVLFVVSAAFWWYFEYLNRFVQNWYYVGVGNLTRRQYFVYATLPFSTVLPAVLGTRELLGTFPGLSTGLDSFVPLRSAHPRAWAWLILVASCIGLAAIGAWPDYLFPLLWLSPLLVITSLQCLRGRRTLFAPLADGDWRNVALLALSALVCGFFWEMWNVHSLAKWIYTVPFVGRFKIFEMPVLGYTGYLPFGLECAVVAQFLASSTPGVENDGGTPRDELARPAGHRSGICAVANRILLALLALYFFILPGVTVVRDTTDPRLRDGRIPRIAWRLHRDISPRYARWARARVESGIAAHLELYDVPSTEWPMFGSVYYLWATEALQRAWEHDPSLSDRAPVEYAHETIEAAVDLILDPIHHTWVRTHWGPEYMHRENVFFRSMIIAACTSHERLVGDGKHRDLLRDQVDSLAAALDASPHGVLEDYPGECYPIDVLAAIACIQRADAVLGTDHSAFLERARRGFRNRMLDERGLPPYLADAASGELLGPSRGVGNSYVLIFAPELWPDAAHEWYQRYEDYFWQKTWWAEGWREYPRTIEAQYAEYMDKRLYYDVDAGPIIAGFSPAANAFGLAAAAVNGRLDHRFTLGTQVLAATWPLPNGSLLGPQILSNRRHAPYLGEACILFFLSQQPAPGTELVKGGHRPGCVWIGYAFYFGTGTLLLLLAFLGLRSRRRHTWAVAYEGAQFATWLALLAAAAILTAFGHAGTALVLVFVALFFPWRQRIQEEGVNREPEPTE